jgi:hypothetical protein
MTDAFTLGLHKILNNPNTSFIKNPHVFNEIHKNSNMSMTSMIRHVGKMEQALRKKKEPSDKERIEKRLNELESKSSSD